MNFSSVLLIGGFFDFIVCCSACYICAICISECQYSRGLFDCVTHGSSLVSIALGLVLELTIWLVTIGSNFLSFLSLIRIEDFFGDCPLHEHCYRCFSQNLLCWIRTVFHTCKVISLNVVIPNLFSDTSLSLIYLGDM